MPVCEPGGCTDGRAGEGLAEDGAGASKQGHGQSMRMRCVGNRCGDSEHERPRRTRASARACPSVSERYLGASFFFFILIV